MLRLLVLGALDLRDPDGREVTAVLAQRRRLALLTFLALAPAGAFQQRAALLTMFWPEADEAHARGALRQALRFLRRELGAAAMPNRGDGEVRLDEKVCWCDAVAFEAAIATGDLRAAIALYRGDLLAGVCIDGAPEFDEWLERRRGRLAREYERAVEHVAVACAADGDHPAAVGCWRTLVERTPTSGRVVLGLMEALAAVGDRAGALLAATRYAALLAREFGAAPEPAILTLAARLRGRG